VAEKRQHQYNLFTLIPMKFASCSVVFPANSMITVLHVLYLALRLLLLDRVEVDDLKNDCAKLLLFCFKRTK
jgi:hypothetical protein